MTTRLVFGLTGQSNMIGSQFPLPTNWPTYANAANIFAWQNGAWVQAKDPLVAGMGVGPGMAFADALITQLGNNIEVGLVQTAIGGSYAAQWVPFWFDVAPWYYGIALAQFRAAGPLSGLIDYQGESDANGQPTSAMVQSWVINKRAMFAGFRSDLCLPELPIILTKIGPMTPVPPGWSSIQTCADQLALISPPKLAVVSAADLVTDSSGVHLTVNSELTLGARYAAAMAPMLPPVGP